MSADNSAIRRVIVCPVIVHLHFLRDNPFFDLDQTFFNELTIREWFTMLSNKMSYFVTRASSIFRNIFSTMKNICQGAKLAFSFFIRFSVQKNQTSCSFCEKKCSDALSRILLESLKTLSKPNRCVYY